MNKTKLKSLIKEHGSVTVKKASGFVTITDRWKFGEEAARYNWSMVRYSSIETYFVGEVVDIHSAGLTLGCDPELFVVNSDGIVPSGFAINSYHEEEPSVTEDGFQLELQPEHNTCREVLGSDLGRAVISANSIAQSAGLELSFTVGQRVPDKVWKESPTELKEFGCNPTLSAHNDKKKRVTGLREKFRAGGGHIHISTGAHDKVKVVKIMDIVAGNTCVLIDRDEANKERRKNYGRAGEYREKSYGIEYRVLSNFWLRSYTLFSLAFSLVRQSVMINDRGLADELISRFDMNKVRKAINENNKELAMENFLILKEFFREKNLVSRSGLCSSNIDKFEEWARTENPMSYIPCGTSQEVLRSWMNKAYGVGDRRGFEIFLQDLVIK